MRARASLLASVITMCVVATGCTNGSSSASTPTSIPTAKSFNGLPQVGALFVGSSGFHICTATVIDAKSRNLVLTAAHCVSGTGAGLSFVPQYHAGIEPFGRWEVEKAFAPPSWLKSGAPSSDMAVLVIAPHRVGNSLVQVESAVGGGEHVGAAPLSGEVVTVPAYGAGTGDKPKTCSTKTYRHEGYPAFDCTPYPDGTSGAPWIKGSGSTATIGGAIGGLLQGGCTPQTSYSAVFGANIQSVIALASSGAPSQHLPPAPASGC